MGVFLGSVVALIENADDEVSVISIHIYYIYIVIDMMSLIVCDDVECVAYRVGCVAHG